MDQKGGLQSGDHTDLHIGVFWQALDCKGLACGKIPREIFSIDSIHIGELRHVAEEDRRLDDVVETNSGFGKDRPQVVHHLVRLGNDVCGDDASGGGIDGDLSGDKQKIAGFDGLAIGPDGGRGVGGIDDFGFHLVKIDLCTHMTIAAITQRHTDKDLTSLFPGAEMRWMNNVPEHHEPEIAAYVDLDFVPEANRIEKLSALLPALVIVNAVTPTLKEIGRPFVRINAWPGFATRKLHELVAPDEATKQQLATLYKEIDCDYRLAPDVPGMISARVVAGIINEAWYTWEENVSTKEEIDIAMRLGTNYPLGPFEWGERIGLGQITGLLWSLSKKDARYTPSKALQGAVKALKCD